MSGSSAVEKQVQFASIEDVLTYYSEEVVPALASANTIGGEFPEEVLNEIRNAMTHIARANHLSKSGENSKVADEIKAAGRHLKRTVLDSLKVTIVNLSEQCDAAIRSLENDIQLPNNIHAQISDIRRRRLDLLSMRGSVHPMK